MTGQYVKNRIRQAGVPLSEVARRLNITPRSLTNRLGVKDMKVSALIEIATAINKELSYYVEGYDPTLAGDDESEPEEYNRTEMVERLLAAKVELVAAYRQTIRVYEQLLEEWESRAKKK